MEQTEQTTQLENLIGFLPHAYRDGSHRMIEENRALFLAAPGSSHNHQAWPGGYVGHISECIRIARTLYPALQTIRAVPFALDDACMGLFVHDLEKPWKYGGTPVIDAHTFRLAKLAEYRMTLTPDIENAVRYTHGEGHDYRNDRRVQTPLAAFVHSCDTISARIWFDEPQWSRPSAND